MILIFLMTEPIRTRSRHVELGRSMHTWLKAMGVAVNGTSDRTIADQPNRIEQCLLSFHLGGQGGEVALRERIIRGSFRGFSEADEHTIVPCRHSSPPPSRCVAVHRAPRATP